MPKAIFEVVVSTLPQFAETGCTGASFIFSANPGEDPKPLHKIASGGELSRIALAVKSVCAHRDDAAVMVLDEVDSGVGGQTGQMIADKIGMIASGVQILCITHLPQIACMADRNYLIEKIAGSNSTKTLVTKLDNEKKIKEIARLIGGETTETSLKYAAELIKNAKAHKKV
jgi:DNA repair protein RecN (Recombination protein N)